MDFLLVSTRNSKTGFEIYPKFIVCKSKDLMIRGGDFYAIWLEEQGRWSTDEQDALEAIDRELDKYARENKEHLGGNPRILHMWDAETRMISSWHQYCQKDMRDSYHMLDEKLIFSNTPSNKKDYASKCLPYPLEEGDISAYEKLMSTLYSPEERHKIEWAIGSIVSGDSKRIQKFMVLYGSAGTGKSTILNIIQQLFDGYYSTFDAKALGSSSNSFALEAFKTNPLVAIQHDGDLSRIEDNTRINSLVSHELMTVNEKFKSTYTNRFKAFLFMGTNRPVKITDSKSGLLRRLIDVTPSGNKVPVKEYNRLTKMIDFELGAIAHHCLQVYTENPNRYDNYIPLAMMGASNDFYNFMLDSYYVFKQDDSTTLSNAWRMYKEYVEEAKVTYSLNRRQFQEELKNYFREYSDRANSAENGRIRSYYSGFRDDRFKGDIKPEPVPDDDIPWLNLIVQKSRLDELCFDCPAQYASEKGTPELPWDKVTTTLADIDTHKLHYARLPDVHVFIDFDIRDKDGNKSFELNRKEASAWPPTYAEVSKGGEGIHLHYIYSGDVSKLARVAAPNVEIKVFTGKSSLRRKLTRCNNLPISPISVLPLREEKKVIDKDILMSEKGLRTTIKKNLRKEIHPGTKPSIDFIFKILEDAYASGMHYDVSDMENAVLVFAMKSTHNSNYCMKKVLQMHFQSEDCAAPALYPSDSPIVFFDIEIFPNLFLLCWKIEGPNHSVVRMFNPKPADIEPLLNYRLVGFNNRKYDNHIVYAAMLGWSVNELYKLSDRIINKRDKDAMFGEAYNISYTDIYDFASASHKQSLKKFEIELGIHHKELGLPWDQPVPEDQWELVAEYCDNDVIATEATFNYLKADWNARLVLAKIAGMTPNDTTNALSTRIIFGKNKKPQGEFNWRDMGDTSVPHHRCQMTADGVLYTNFGDEYTVFDDLGRPIFPGYKYEYGKSTYRDICPDNPDPERRQVGEGGYVYSEPGMYTDVATLDVASMHPSSIIAEDLFGPEYTKRFREIKDARVAIKHSDYDTALGMLNGALSDAIDMIKRGEMTNDDLALALKTVINSVYGLTSAKFQNEFRDPRNVDNIVAKRGALFMINLRNEVQARGWTVAHIKTDSIKIPNANKEIIDFVCDYGKQYGYIFEHESTYERMCLVNKAVLIARYASPEWCQERYGYIPSDNAKHAKSGEMWSATGAQFAIPYVFKTLFSHEPITFLDMCETKSVTSSLYLDMNEKLPEGEHDYHYIGKVSSFCPIRDGCGGGKLMRETSDPKTGEKGYASATGAKDYRWLEAETLRPLPSEEVKDLIDIRYYRKLVDEAVDTIGKFGDSSWFLDPSLRENGVEMSDTPPWETQGVPWEEDPTYQFDVR